ncbi:MAG: nodulation protein NfeD [Chloroflexi bacterium]|nr:nodulation protein NfeD [Chloroflexota bacterium]
MAAKVLSGATCTLLIALLWLASSAGAEEAMRRSDLPAALRGTAPLLGESPAPVHVARLTGVIDPIAAQHLVRILDRAEHEGAAALILLLDTPGGLDSAMRAMTQRILAAKVPVIVYVAPAGARAASAGMFIALAAHIAAMTPGTNIGAAHPVSVGGQTDPVMADKLANDAASTARALAGQRGRNADWADRAVRESISATDAEALAGGVIDLVARDLDDLCDRLDGRTVQTADGPRRLATRGAPRVVADMTILEATLHTLLNPNVAFILLNLGVLGLLAEFYHPGTLVPGISGVIAILLAFVALGTLPVNSGGVLLLLLAFVLFVVDVYAAAHGVLSVGGAVAFVLGGLLLFSPLDARPWQPGPLAVSPWVVGGIAAVFVAFFLLVVRTSLTVRRLGVQMRDGPDVGQIAVALTDLDPDGVVRLAGEDWSAIAEAGAIRAGDSVEVVEREGLRLRVRRAAAASSPSIAPS